MTEILDRTAYQRPGSFSEVRPPRIRARSERLPPVFGSERCETHIARKKTRSCFAPFAK